MCLYSLSTSSRLIFNSLPQCGHLITGADAFDVFFLNNRKQLVKKVEEVYLDNLVDVIDWNVEKDNSFDYDKRVKQQYSISL